MEKIVHDKVNEFEALHSSHHRLYSQYDIDVLNFNRTRVILLIDGRIHSLAARTTNGLSVKHHLSLNAACSSDSDSCQSQSLMTSDDDAVPATFHPFVTDSAATCCAPTSLKNPPNFRHPGILSRSCGPQHPMSSHRANSHRQPSPTSLCCQQLPLFAPGACIE